MPTRLTFTLQILLKNFGLEARLAITRPSDRALSLWTPKKDHIWFDMEELQTTICYLTVQQQSAQRRYEKSEWEEDEGVNHTVNTAQSSVINLASLINQPSRTKQFQRALRILKLKPYLHPSQSGAGLFATNASRVGHDQPECGGDEQKRKMNDGKSDCYHTEFAADCQQTSLRLNGRN